MAQRRSANGFLDRLEQGVVGFRIVKGWPGASSIDTPPSGSRKRTGPFMALSRAPIHSPKARFSSRVVRIRVTFGLWMTNLRLRNFSGTLSRGPKLTMSSAPVEPT